MAPQSVDEYMATYGQPDRDDPVIDLDTTDMQRHTMVVTFAGGAKKAVVQFIGLAAHTPDEHLCIDVHAFVNNELGRSSVFGLEHGRRFEGFTETAPGRSHGRPAVRGVSVLIGAQADTEPHIADQAGRRNVAAAAPTVINDHPVLAAVAEHADASSWIVICRRTDRTPDRTADTPWYVTWRVWWANERWHAENGDYGPHHGLTWTEAQQSLLRRLDLPPASAPVVDLDVYVHASDDGDWLTCPSCHQPITMIDSGDTLGSLLTAVSAHRCSPAADNATP